MSRSSHGRTPRSVRRNAGYAIHQLEVAMSAAKAALAATSDLTAHDEAQALVAKISAAKASASRLHAAAGRAQAAAEMELTER